MRADRRESWIVALALGSLLCSLAAHGAQLAPGDLVKTVSPAPAPAASFCVAGYRPQAVLQDFILGARWVILASCSHPELPRIAVPAPVLSRADLGSELEPRSLTLRAGQTQLPGALPAAFPTHSDGRLQVLENREVLTSLGGRAVVRTGDRVRLWRRDEVARVDLSATALTSGAPGASIRLRLGGSSGVLEGVVRAAGSVELKLDPRPGFVRGGQ